MSALDAERAFAADAKTIGQWTAFRKWSSDDAVMFVPQLVDAHSWLIGRADPAKAIDWWPTASYISCDGNFAVNTGGWKRPDGTVGRFSTVWKRLKDGGWKWVLHIGDQTTTPLPRPDQPVTKTAKCLKSKLFFFGLKPRPYMIGLSEDDSLYWTIWRDKTTIEFRVSQMEGQENLISNQIDLAK